MEIRIGKVKQEKSLDDIAVMHSTATVVEKVQGIYREVLICRDLHYIDVGGQITGAETENTFSVYVNKTVEEVLQEKDITEYAWIEPMVEVG